MELVVGRVVKSHGLAGELVVEVRTDSPDERFSVGARLQGRLPGSSPQRTYTVVSARDHSGRLLVRLAGVADRDAADALRGTIFVIDSADVSSPEDPDEYYDHELEGLVVKLADGTTVGTVREVLHTPGAELLAVASAVDGAEILIPFVAAIVTTICLTEASIVIDPPEGLLP